METTRRPGGAGGSPSGARTGAGRFGYVQGCAAVEEAGLNNSRRLVTVALGLRRALGSDPPDPVAPLGREGDLLAAREPVRRPVDDWKLAGGRGTPAPGQRIAPGADGAGRGWERQPGLAATLGRSRPPAARLRTAKGNAGGEKPG